MLDILHQSARLGARIAGASAAAMLMTQVALGQPEQPMGQMDEPEATVVAPGQVDETDPAVVEPAVFETTLTFRSHSIAAGASAGNLEGNACPTTHTMIAGSCHPGYNDRVIIINQFPNIPARTWRCGFRNNTTGSRTVWIYTLCGR